MSGVSETKAVVDERKLNGGLTSSGTSEEGSKLQFKSEVYIPIKRDNDASHQFIWENVRDKMSERLHSWEDKVSQIRQEFFNLRPAVTSNDQSHAIDRANNKLLTLMDFSEQPEVNHAKLRREMSRFDVSFDVRDFKPDDISVTLRDRRLTVEAKREVAMSDGKKILHDFKQHLDLPVSASIDQLVCTLSQDGVLQIKDMADISLPSPTVFSYPTTPSSSPSLSAPLSPSSPTSSRDSDSRSWKFESCEVMDKQKVANDSVAGLMSSSTPVRVESSCREDRFELIVNIGLDYQPEDVVVKTVDRRVMIHARHEERAPGRTSCKQFTRHFDLPNNVEPSTVTASVTDTGQLIIEAPYSFQLMIPDN